jgi:arsenical pump membrane protein
VTLLAIAIFVATLTLVIWQPRGLSIGWSACAGAGLALLLHVVTLHNVVTVTGIVWDATLTFVSIIITSTVLDRVGFFEWAALKMAHAAKGSGQRAFVYVILLGAMVSAFFANDGAALILTPIVLEKVRLLKFDDKKMLPFIMAGGFIADTASLPLVVSNLVNIVSADYFHIGFLTYLIRMVAPDLVSIGASLLVLWLYFRRDVPRHYDPANLPAARSAIADERMFKLSWLILSVLLVGYLFTEILHIPVSSVAGVIALVFLLVGGARGVVKPWRIVREAPWAIVFFSIGMYVVVYGLKNVGLTALLGTLVAATSHAGAYVSVLSVGFLAAILSSVMNNMPSVMIGALALHGVGVSAAHHAQLVYANIIGCDLGPKITPIGSLATLLWLDVLRKKGVTITWRRYFRTGIVLTVPTLFLTLSGLYAWSLLSLH